MSPYSVLQERFAETEERIKKLVQHLKDHADLEASLRKAGNGLTDASGEIKSLVDSAKVASEGLAEILGSFRETIETFRQSDPASTAKAIAAAEERLAGEVGRVEKMIDDAAVAILGKQAKTEQHVDRALLVAMKRLEARIDESIASAVGRIEEKSDEAVGAISKEQEKTHQQLEGAVRERLGKIEWKIKEAADAGSKGRVGLSKKLDSIRTTVIYITLAVVLVVLLLLPLLVLEFSP